MKPQEYEPLINIIEEYLGIDTTGCLSNLQPVKPHVSTNVPIIHGCDEFCSFCIIPYRRGRQISRNISDIINEVTLLTQKGVKEITLLGQTVDAYGHDLSSKTDLSELLQAVNEIDQLERIRFLTSHPLYMSDKIIESVASLSKVCEHILLPFQAGADSVLGNMRRGYTKQNYLSLVEKIKSRVPNVSMSTDVIVGFPGETQAEFESTLDILEQIKFDKVHMAAYSRRPGTIAYRTMEDSVELTEKKRRLKSVEQLQEKISSEINSSLVGQFLDILVEGKYGNKWFGRTRTNKLVYFDSENDLSGNIANVLIHESSPWSLKGKLNAPNPAINKGEEYVH
jgi:tRNA-2-methylthio-N6-dimethylallyladenosine synthase